MRGIALVLFLMLLGSPALAQKENAAKTDDLRCVVVAFSMQQSTIEIARASSLPAALYFLGRVDGREPAIDLEAQLTEVTLAMAKEPHEVFQATASRCGKILIDKGQLLTTIGKHMQARGLKMLQQEQSL